jgi:hypothetical protein
VTPCSRSDAFRRLSCDAGMLCVFAECRLVTSNLHPESAFLTFSHPQFPGILL